MQPIDRRDFLKRAELALAAGAIGAVSPSAQAASIVDLAPGDSVQAAIDAIVDASPTNRYVVRLPAGTYTPWRMQPFVNVQGAGLATIVNTNAAQAIQLASDVQLSDMRIVYDDDAGGSGPRGAIEKLSGNCRNLWLDRLEIEVSARGAPGDRYAILLQQNTVSVYLRDTNIVTKAGGIYMASAGNLVGQGCNIFLIGEDDWAESGLNHYGLVLDSAARIRWFGGHISCGYSHGTAPNPNESIKDIVCVLVPSDNTQSSARIDLFSVWMYAHNTATVIDGKLNTTRAENGWIRRYNCAEQAENPNTTPPWSATAAFGVYNTALQPPQGSGGINQMFGGRATGRADGNVAGQLIILDGLSPPAPQLDEADNGIIQLDSSAGPFTVTLARNNRGIGQELTFVNHPGDNPVTLDATYDKVITPWYPAGHRASRRGLPPATGITLAVDRTAGSTGAVPGRIQRHR